MPCTDYGRSTMEGHDCFKNRQVKEQITELKDRIVHLTALLCSTCRALASTQYDFDLNPELSRWWDTHKQEDDTREKTEARARLRQELARELSRKPVKDLTADDRDILKEQGYL